MVARMRELSAQYPRYGYRRIRIFLGRDGYRMSPGRAYRLWRAASLQLPRKRPRKRVAAARPRPQAPCGPNQVWSYDFVFDHCANGQQLKCLTVTDEFTKEGLAIDVDGHIRSARVIEVLSRLVSTRGAPTFLRSDNGPEFVSKALLSWIVAHGIGTALIEPGKPWQNGVTESFNGKFRDECLSLEWFRSRAEAKVIIEAWRRHYNEVRPHSSLDYLTPNEFVAQAARPAPRNATGRGAAADGASAPPCTTRWPIALSPACRCRESRAKSSRRRSSWLSLAPPSSNLLSITVRPPDSRANKCGAIPIFSISPRKSSRNPMPISDCHRENLRLEDPALRVRMSLAMASRLTRFASPRVSRRCGPPSCKASSIFESPACLRHAD